MDLKYLEEAMDLLNKCLEEETEYLEEATSTTATLTLTSDQRDEIKSRLELLANLRKCQLAANMHSEAVNHFNTQAAN